MLYLLQSNERAIILAVFKNQGRSGGYMMVMSHFCGLPRGQGVNPVNMLYSLM